MLFFYRMCVERVLFELCSVMLGVRTYSNVVMFRVRKNTNAKNKFLVYYHFSRRLGGVILY